MVALRAHNDDAGLYQKQKKNDAWEDRRKLIFQSIIK